MAGATHIVTLIASTTVTGTGSDASEWFNLSRYSEGILYIDVTDIDGTDIVVAVETSPDDDEDTRQAFEAYDDTGSEASYTIPNVNQISKKFSNFGKWLRVTYTFTGTDVTFRVLFAGKVK